MRSSFLLSMGALVLVSGSFLSGCGDEVTDNGSGTGASGGNGSGGAGGAGTGATGAGAGSTGGSATGGAGTGAGNTGGFANTCEEACAYATTCGADLCGLLSIDCADPQAECPADCLLAAECDAIVGTAAGNPDPVLVGCAQACGGGGGGVGGGGASDCQTCAVSNCLPANCNSMPCQTWLQCAANCSDPDCFTACDAANPGASNEQATFYACTCADCTADCAGITPPCL